MNYLRMLTNAVAAGILAAAYVIVLLLLLNPTESLRPWAIAPLAFWLGIYYTAAVGAIVFIALLLRHLFGRGRVSPAWVSVNVLVWLSAIVSGTGAVVMWLNVRTFSLVLEAGVTETLGRSAIVLVAASAILVLIAVFQRYGGHRMLWASGMMIVALASVVVPLVLRGPAQPAPFDARPVGDLPPVPRSERHGRVRVIALDAGSLEVIANAAAEGRLPNFGRILDRGAVAHLATLHPTTVEAVWSAVATGKLPQKNGVRSSAIYRLRGRRQDVALQLLPDYCFASGLVRFGLLEEEPRTSTSIRTRTLWELLGGADVRVGVVNFPLTYPVPALNGYVISDALARLRRTHSLASEREVVYPPDLFAGLDLDLVSDPRLTPLPPDIPERYRAGARDDHFYEALQAIADTNPVQVALRRYESPDQIAHYFLRYTMPSRFGDVSEDDRRQFGGVLEAHYAMVDAAIGRELSTLGDEDLLLVVSGFGIEPLSISKRILERLIGDPDISGTHESAPDGFLMAYGASIARGGPVRRGSIVDVVPTMLYFLGLPIGRDMDGFARTDLFQQAFTDEHPITFIPSYDR